MINDVTSYNQKMIGFIGPRRHIVTRSIAYLQQNPTNS